MRLRGRAWALQVGDVEYSGFDMDFRAQYGEDGIGDCRIAISNAPRELAPSLSVDGQVVRLLAGYADSGAVEVARGGVVLDSVTDRRAGVDMVLSWAISSARGTIRAPVVSRWWPSPSAEEVIRWLAAQAGVAVDVLRLGRTTRYPGGLLTQGRIAPILDRLCADSGSRWALDDGRLRVWPRGGTARRTAEVWSAGGRTLLGLAVSGGGVRRLSVRGILTAHLRRGDALRVVDDLYSGDVLIDEVEHIGSTRSDAWDTVVTGRPA
jgi:hypothetical protein